ncbi:hypothetical protein UPYG_G00130610 [Umbra pygmaea]|uniref:SHSP domain-containing protein n=1 Tax=Umbra pygmaea TaxID=75934 RepID=A0ABD0XAV0_UMBPY
MCTSSWLQSELWSDEQPEDKFGQYGWRCGTSEDGYGTGTLIGNWVEQRNDVIHYRKSRSLPSQFTHYFDTTYSSSFNREEKRPFYTLRMESRSFPGHQPELDRLDSKTPGWCQGSLGVKHSFGSPDHPPPVPPLSVSTLVPVFSLAAYRFMMAERILPHAYPMSTQYELSSPRRIYDQNFGEALTFQDLLTPTLFHGYYVRPRINKQLGRGFSEIKEESGQWSVLLDVCQFTPDEITVRTVDNLLEVIGNHAQRQDAHGFVSRSFSRTYVLPVGVDPLLLHADLSHDGILSVSGPRTAPDPPSTRTLVIQRDKAV